jgi:hypothetical protein
MIATFRHFGGGRRFQTVDPAAANRSRSQHFSELIARVRSRTWSQNPVTFSTDDTSATPRKDRHVERAAPAPMPTGIRSVAQTRHRPFWRAAWLSLIVCAGGTCPVGQVVCRARRGVLRRLSPVST